MSKDPIRYESSGSGLSFDRVAFFSDAVFAIAMTLLVVGIGLPDDLDTVFGEKRSEIISFFIGFAVLANYWLAHHRFVTQLRAVDLGLMRLNLIYLAAIAFLPFPTGMLGKFEYATSIFLMFAVTLAVASLLETAMLIHARNAELLVNVPSSAAFRYMVTGSIIPVALFAASVPIAFWSTTAALTSWLLIIPAEMYLDRRATARGLDINL